MIKPEGMLCNLDNNRSHCIMVGRWTMVRYKLKKRPWAKHQTTSTNVCMNGCARWHDIHGGAQNSHTHRLKIHQVRKFDGKQCLDVPVVFRLHIMHLGLELRLTGLEVPVATRLTFLYDGHTFELPCPYIYLFTSNLPGGASLLQGSRCRGRCRCASEYRQHQSQKRRSGLVRNC